MELIERLVRGTKIDHLVFILLRGFVFLLVLSVIILASVPPVSKDALVHHLAIPKLYLKHGGICEIPSMVFSYYPMNLHLLYLVPLYFGNDIIPKLIHFGFALLTAWLIFDYLKRRINVIYGLLGAIFFLSIPIIVKLSITVYVDLGIIFFSTASLLFLFRWIEGHLRLRFLIISAVLCGLAMGTKYNGLITLLLLTLFAPFLYLRYAKGARSGFWKPVSYGMLFLFVAILFFSPWMIRNYSWTHNPIFPLYDHWFNPQSDISKQGVSLFTYRSLVYHETWWQMALLPARIFFQGQDGSPQYFDGKLNPFLLFLPFFAFYRIRSDPEPIRNEVKILLAYAVLFFAFAFFSRGLRIRYIAPIIPPLVILSTIGVRKMVEALRRLGSQSLQTIGCTSILVMLGLSLWPNVRYLMDQYRHVAPFSYLRGDVTRDEYIEKYRLEYPAMRYINKNLRPDAKILFICMGNRGYYCDREYVFDMYQNRSMLQQSVRESINTDEALQRLQGGGITHLLICYDVFDRWVKRSFTIQEQELLNRFFKKHVRLLHFERGYGVYRLEYDSLLVHALYLYGNPPFTYTRNHTSMSSGSLLATHGRGALLMTKEAFGPGMEGKEMAFQRPRNMADMRWQGFCMLSRRI